MGSPAIGAHLAHRLASRLVLSTAMIAGLGAIGVSAFFPPAAIAQTQQQAPKVSEQDALQLFKELTYNSIYWKKPSVLADLQERYQNATNDQQRALYVAATAMGMPDMVVNAAKAAISYSPIGNYGSEVGQWEFDTAVKQYANTLVNDQGKQVPLVYQIADSAGILLGAAKKHNMGFTDYMKNVYIPHDFSGNRAGLYTQNAARFLLGIPVNNAMASIRQP